MPHKDGGQMLFLHKVSSAQGCRTSHCFGQSYGAGQCSLTRGHHAGWYRGTICWRSVVLHILCPFFAGGLPVGAATYSDCHQGCWACMSIPALISLQIEPHWDALGLCKVPCMHALLFSHMLHTQMASYAGYCGSVDGRFVTAKVLVPQCLDACNVITASVWL